MIVPTVMHKIIFLLVKWNKYLDEIHYMKKLYILIPILLTTDNKFAFLRFLLASIPEKEKKKTLFLGKKK